MASPHVAGRGRAGLVAQPRPDQRAGAARSSRAPATTWTRPTRASSACWAAGGVNASRGCRRRRSSRHRRSTSAADLTGDGRADIVGFGDAGVWVSLTTATAPSRPPRRSIDNFAYDAGGWRVEQAPALPRRPDRRRPRRHRRLRRRRRLGVAATTATAPSSRPSDGRRQLRLQRRRLAGREAPAVPRRPDRRRPRRHRRVRRRTGSGSSLNNGDGTFQPPRRCVDNFALQRRRLARREAPAVPRRPDRRRPRRHRRVRRRRGLGRRSTTATAPSSAPQGGRQLRATTPAAGASRSTRASSPT